MDSKKAIIKKYENRRLYDTTASRYVNLDEVAQMLRNGIDVQVLDAASGEDLTRQVLTQIIAENTKGGESAFPLDILRQMAIASGKVGQEGLLNSMRAMFDFYQSSYRALSNPFTPFEFIERMMSRPAQLASKSPQEPATDAKREESDEVIELRKRVERLEGMLARSSSDPPKRRRTKKTKKLEE